MKKVSEMMVAVGGDLLSQVDSLEEMQAHLDLVRDAWNMSLYSENKRKVKLKRFIESQKPYAPNQEALLGLEWEYKRIIQQRLKKFPLVKNKIIAAEGIEVAKDDYIIRAYFAGEHEEIELN